MKQRRQERVEHRRSLVEINLISDTKPGLRAGLKPGSRTARGGCARLFGAVLVALAAVPIILSGHS